MNVTNGKYIYNIIQLFMTHKIKNKVSQVWMPHTYFPNRNKVVIITRINGDILLNIIITSRIIINHSEYRDGTQTHDPSMNLIWCNGINVIYNAAVCTFASPSSDLSNTLNCRLWYGKSESKWRVAILYATISYSLWVCCFLYKW